MADANVNNLRAEALRIHRAGRLAESVEHYRLALALEPLHAPTLVNAGAAMRALGRLDEAAEHLLRAIAIEPSLAQAHNNLGNVCRERGRLDEAIVAYGTALKLHPDDAEAICNLATTLKDAGRVREAIDGYRRAIELRPDFAESHANLVFALRFDPDADDRVILEETRRWAERFAPPRLADRLAAPRDSDPERRLRIGYVGADFRDHCQAFYLAPVLKHHDRERFEIHVYSSVLRPDAITARLRGLVECWNDVAALNDAELVAKIRADGIDVLVDLTMHMAGGRLGVFARRAAPVQVTWLAYPGTTGVREMDYRLTDPQLDPPGALEDVYSEQSVRLPETFWCYDPLCNGPEVNALPAMSGGRVTFGCLNNFCKVNERSLALWAAAMRRVEGSAMILLAPEGEHRRAAVAAMDGWGIGAERIEFVSPRPHADYLALYHRIDIALDTIPYNGHTTSLDAMWMGVPVVTRAAVGRDGVPGGTVAGRAGVSQLTNLGLTELIARSDDGFVDIAAMVASDLPRLSRLRETLRGRMEASPLMDAFRFTRGLESAYREMWRGRVEALPSMTQ